MSLLLEAIDHELLREDLRHELAVAKLLAIRQLAEGLDVPAPAAIAEADVVEELPTPAPDVETAGGGGDEGPADYELSPGSVASPPAAPGPGGGLPDLADRPGLSKVEVGRRHRVAVLEVFRARPGEWLAPRDLLEATSVAPTSMSGALRMLRDAGELEHNGRLRTAVRYRLPAPDPGVDASPPAEVAAPEREPADKAARAERAHQVEKQVSEAAERVLDALRAGPRTAAELAAELGTARSRIQGQLTWLGKAGRAEIRGARDGKSVWRRVPLPHERPDVKITNGAGKVTETQIVECLRWSDSLTIGELAKELMATPAEVALEVSRLERAGRALKQAGGRYRLTEAPA